MRRHTRGYTGQKSSTLRHTYPTAKDVQDAIAQVTALIESNFASMGANEYNQFVRGHLFVLVDSLATIQTLKTPQFKDEAMITLELCTKVVKLMCKWLKLFPEYLQYYVECGQVQNLYLVSLKHAVAASLPELAEMLKLSFGLIARGEQKFASLSKELKMKQSISNSYSSSDNLFQKACIAAFNEEKGFELVVEAVTKTGNQCPISVITDLLDPLTGILNVQKDEGAKTSIGEICKKLIIRFSDLNDKDIKEISKPSIQKLFSILESIMPSKGFLGFGKDSMGSIKEDMLKTLFSIAVQLINTPYIQKRLLGIAMIKEMIPRQTRYIPSNTEWKDSAQLIKTMEEKKLLEIVLGENAHSEIIRKTEDIFTLYLTNKKLEKRHIELLWKCANEKHEDVMRACLDLLVNLIKKMGTPLIQELFKLIETADYKNEILIKFLETYTSTVLKLQTDYITRKPDPSKTKLYDLDIFWKLILDPNVQGKLKDQAMSALVKLLEDHTFLLNEYVYKAADLIKNRKVTIRGIQLLKRTDFAGYFITTQGKRRNAYNIEEIIDKYSFFSSILQDCEDYHLEVKKKVETLADKSIMDTNFGSGFAFHDQATLYVDFLLYLCEKSGLTLSKEEFMKLWKCYVEESLCEEHSDILFKAKKGIEQTNQPEIIKSSERNETENKVLANIKDETKDIKIEFAPPLKSDTARELNNQPVRNNGRVEESKEYAAMKDSPSVTDPQGGNSTSLSGRHEIQPHNFDKAREADTMKYKKTKSCCNCLLL